MNDQVKEEVIPVTLENNSLKKFLKNHFDYPFTRLEYFSIFFIQFLGVCNCIIFNRYLEFSSVKSNSKRYSLIMTLSSISPVLGFFGLITWKLSQGLYMNMIILPLLILIPSIILLVLILKELSFEYLEITVTCVFFLVSIIGFQILKLIRRKVQEIVGRNNGEILAMVLVLCCNLLFNLLVYALVLYQDLDSGNKIIIKFAAGTWIIILIILCVVLHLVVFKKQPNDIQALKDEILMNYNHSIKVQIILHENPEVFSGRNEGFFQSHGHFIASLGIFIPFLSVQIWLISILSDFKAGRYPNSIFYLSMFYVIVSPLFLFTGIAFSSCKLIVHDKYLVILVFFALFPTIFVEWLSFYLCSFEGTYYLGLVLGIGFPAALVFWLFMATIFQYHKKTFQYLSSICCLIFVLPFGLVLPFSYAGGMNQMTLWVTDGALLSFGILLMSFWVFQVLIVVNKQICSLIRVISRFHIEDLSLCLYCYSFLLGYSLIVWMTFKRINIKNDWKAGLLFESFLILGLILLSSLFTQRLELHQKDEEIPEENITEIIFSQSKQLTKIQSLKQKQKKKYQLILTLFSILLILTISITLLLSNPFKSSELSGKIFMIGGFISLLVFLILIELKHFLKQFGQSVISFILGYCWLFCFIPLTVIIPVSLGSASTEAEQQKIISWSIGIILLIFMIGVSILSITFNLLLKKLEYEKIAKFCCLYVQEVLHFHGMKSSLIDLRDIYDCFFHTSADAIEKVLLAQHVYSYRKLEENEKDDCIELINIKKISRIKNLQSDNGQEDENGLKISDICRKMCRKRKGTIFQEAKLLPDELGDIINEQHEPKNNENNELTTNIFQQKFESKKESEILTENKNELEANHHVKLELISALKLKKKKKLELQNSPELKKIIENLNIRLMWTKAVFAKFSNGMISKDGEAWMNLSDLRQFVSLSGLQDIIDNAVVDILFVKITKRYYMDTNSITHQKINFEVFLDKVLPELLTLANAKIKIIQTQEDLIREKIFPYLVNVFPSLMNVIQNFEDQNIEDKEEFLKGDLDVKDLENTDEQRVLDKYLQSSKPIEQNLNVVKKINHQKEKKRICSSFLDYFSLCFYCFFRVLISCFGKILYSCFNNLHKIPEYTNINQMASQLFSPNEIPSWENLCKLISSKFEEIDAEARKNHAKMTVFLSINLTNAFAILEHLLDLYSFSSISLLKEIGWFDENPLSEVSQLIMAFNKYWLQTFWTCFICSLIFVILLIPALKLIKQNRFGLESDFTVAKFPSPNFFLSRLIGLFGNSFYLTVMCAMLSSFSCINEDDSWKLMRSPNIECFSADHMPYFLISILTIIVYYPAATLVLPSISYQDKVLDIKYDTTYLVLESQGKILIAAVAVFFNKEKYIWIMLVVSVLVSVLLFFTCLKMKPCLVQSYNLWKTGGFLVPAWIGCCSLVKLYTQDDFFSFWLLVAGLGGILSALIFLYGKFYGCRRRRRTRIQKKMLEEQVNISKIKGSQKVSKLNDTVVPEVYNDSKSSMKITT